MTADLIKRLEAAYKSSLPVGDLWNLCAEAADELERLTSQAPAEGDLTDEQIDAATASARDALLDYIYEHGTAAEGVLRLVRKVARAAVAAANVQPKHTNPNNCDACDHKRHPDGGWCYMFRDEPTEVCAKHTARASLQAPAPEDGHGPKCLKGMLEDDEGAKHPCTCGARKPPTRGQLFTALNEVAELIGDCEEWAITEDPQVVVSMVKDYMAGVSLAIQAPAVGADDAKDAARFRWLIDDRNWNENEDTPSVCTSEDVHWGDKARSLIDRHMEAKG